MHEGLFRASPSQQCGKRLVFHPEAAKLNLQRGCLGFWKLRPASVESWDKAQGLFKDWLLPDISFIQSLSQGCQPWACRNPTDKSSSGIIRKSVIYFKGGGPRQSVGWAWEKLARAQGCWRRSDRAGMWKVVEAAGEQHLLHFSPVSLLVAIWLPPLIGAVTSLAPFWISLLGKRWTEGLHGDLDAVYILGFPALHCKWFNIGNTCPMAWKNVKNCRLRILVGFRFICFIQKVELEISTYIFLNDLPLKITTFWCKLAKLPWTKWSPSSLHQMRTKGTIHASPVVMTLKRI